MNKDILLIIVGVSALLSTFVIYGRFNDILLTEEATRVLENLSRLVYLMMAISLPIIALGSYRLIKRINNNTINNILLILNDKRYLRIFVISLITYGIFYSFITNLLVYRPDEVFSEIYNVSIPSFRIVPCCGTPGYMPMLVGYITEHFGILIIPINLILLLVISTLVGINITVSIFIFKNKPKNANANWLSGLGATIGLFTGCPTCAGTFFILLFGLSSSVSMAILAPLQSLFIAVSIPVLLLTPAFMIKRFYTCKIK